MKSFNSLDFKIRHLYSRAAFGLPLSLVNDEPFPSVQITLANLFRDSDTYIPIKLMEANPMKRSEIRTMSPEEKKEIKKSAPVLLKELNAVWLEKIASGDHEMREKLTLFWSNHFSCRNGNPYFTQELNNAIRKNAFGNFKDLLLAVSKSAAMLQFLNNQQNRKLKPNENFAREVMELFTLGRGNYSEYDIKEAARAFTGWGFDEDGNFVFRDRIHDFGEKTFLGKTGNFTGEEVLNIITSSPKCAQFIASKIYTSFVNELPNANHIKDLGDVLYKNEYDIRKTFTYLFSTDWFYDAENIGSKIKSPVELMVPMMRDFKVKFASDTVTLGFQRILGQVLFNPPNVAGWLGGKNWIDSSTLAFRMKLPSVMLADLVPDVIPKDEGDVNNALSSGTSTIGRSRCEADWSEIMKKFSPYKTDDLYSQLQFYLIALPEGGPPYSFAKTFIDSSNESALVHSTVLYFMSIPEYQLC